MKRYVVGLAYDQASNFFLIKKKSPSWQEGYFNGPGGVCKDNEFPLDAMVRTFEKETTMSILRKDWTKFLIITGKDYEIYFYHAELLTLRWLQGTDREPGITIALLNLRTCKVIEDLKWIIPLIFDKNNELPVVVKRKK